MTHIKAILFDLDGTVNDTVTDLAVSVNEDMAAEKIGAVSGAVNSGTYDISPEAIADAILMF